MHSIIEENRNKITDICEQNNVKSLYFFGSVTDPERFRPDSDIDVLVSFKDDISMDEYTDSFFRLLFSLEDILERKVDITTERSVKKPYFRDELDKTKVLFFESLSAVDG